MRKMHVKIFENRIKNIFNVFQGSDQMRTAVTPPNKGSEDIKPGDQTHATGTGHHMKTAAKKCKHFICY